MNRFTKCDLYWMIPVGVRLRSQIPSNFVSDAGLIAPYALPGAMLLFGAMKHDAHASEAGRLGVEAELDAEVVMQVLKFATNRARPNLADNKSFPSGHAMSAFALAAVMSREYHDKPLVVFGSYGLLQPSASPA